jgi:ribosomal protein L31E
MLSTVSRCTLDTVRVWKRAMRAVLMLRGKNSRGAESGRKEAPSAFLAGRWS